MLYMKYLIIFCILVIQSYSLLGVDISQAAPKEYFDCLPKNNFTFIIIRSYLSVGKPDPAVVASIMNSYAAGINLVDVYFFPCYKCRSKKSPQDQVKEAYENLKQGGVEFNRMWFDIEGAKHWGTDQSVNRNFFDGLLEGANTYSLKIGVYASIRNWDPIFGSNYTIASQYPLWYAHYDGKPNFDDWEPYGGWTSPNIKQYHGTTTDPCKMGIDINWCSDTSCPN